MRYFETLINLATKIGSLRNFKNRSMLIYDENTLSRAVKEDFEI